MRYVEVELDGKTRKLRYDFNAIADLEEKAGASVGKLFGDFGFNAIRLLVWAGLKWSEKSITVQAAGQLLQSYIENDGDMEVISAKITQALTNSGVLGKPQGNEPAETET